MSVGKYQFYLAGVPTQEVANWENFETNASFINDTRGVETAQPVLGISEVSLHGGAARQVIQYIEDGKNNTGTGIMEAMPFTAFVTDGINQDIVQNRLLDLPRISIKNDSFITCPLIDREGLDSFDGQANKQYFNILEARNVINVNDYIPIPYVVEKVDAFGELANLTLTLFTMTTSLITQGQLIANTVANLAAHIAGGLSGPAAGFVFLWATAAVQVGAFGLMFNATIQTMKQLAAIIAPPIRNHMAINQRVMFTKALKDLGYKFETNITEMNNVAILPGNQFGIKANPSGAPRLGQFGQTLGQQISAALTTYHAHVAIIDGTVHIRSVNDSFWIKNSTYILPFVGDDSTDAVNLQSELIEYNAKDARTNAQVSFANDLQDEHLALNWKGMHFLRVAEPIQVNDIKNLRFSGKDDVRIPVSLGVRKDDLSEVETLLRVVLKAADSFVRFFGGNSNLAGLINNRLGVLKLSNTVYSNPKWIWIEKSQGQYRIPANHRDKLSARAMYVSYHAEKSIVNTRPVLQISSTNDLSVNYLDIAPPNYGNQKQVVEGLPVPFSYNDERSLKKNSYFATNDGKDAKIENSVWNLYQNKARQSYWVREVWSRNVKEFFIEPISAA